MPNRLIRDGLLESEAVLSLPIEARWLYVSIILSADDVGLFEATPFRLARRADIRREHAERLVQLLVDADLVRLYNADGRHFGFIPRFRQRIQIKRIKHPLPPAALYSDDSDALNKINDLAPKTTVGHPLRNRCAGDGQPSEPEPEPEPKEKKNTSQPRLPALFSRFWDAWPKTPRKAARKQCEAKWRSLGCDAIADQILAAVADQIPAWKAEGYRYCPAPLTWLNQARWEAPATTVVAEEVRPWHETRAGVERMAATVGIAPWDECIQWSAYKSRVMARITTKAKQ